MAPIATFDKTSLLAALRSGRPAAPYELGAGAPEGFVDDRAGRWRLVRRAMSEASRARMTAEENARLARGDSWMPEHTYAYYDVEEVLLESSDKQDFIARLASMPWPFGDG